MTPAPGISAAPAQGQGNIRRIYSAGLPSDSFTRGRTKVQPDPEQVLTLVRQAGQEALRCSGPSWYPRYDLEAGFDGNSALGITMAGFRHMRLTVHPRAFPNACCGLYNKGTAPNPFFVMENTAGALVRLYAGYFDRCPLDAWRHERLIDYALDGAFPGRWPTRREEQLAERVVLFFERSLVSYELTREEGELFVSGTIWEQVVNARQRTMLQALFERSQALLLPEAWERNPGSPPGTSDPLAEALLPDVLPILFGVKLRFTRGVPQVRGRVRRRESYEWGRQVRALAELLVPYLEEEQEDPNMPQRPAPPNPFTEPGGVGGRPGGSGTGAPAGLPPMPGLPPGAPEAPDAGTGRPPCPRPGRGVGQGPGAGIDAQDEYYAARAKALEVRYPSEEGKKKAPERLRMGGLAYEEVPTEALHRSRVCFSRTRPVEADEDHPLGLKFFRQAWPIEVPVQGEEEKKQGVPHLMIVCDSSSSMGYVPQGPEGARGNYDLCLLSAYGIFRHIEESGVAPQVQVCTMNFSNQTFSSGWRPATNMQAAKRTLLRYQGGGTTLDTGVLEEVVRRAPGEFLAVLVTDGGLGNTNDALEVFRGVKQEGNGVVLLHIGTDNAFTQGIREMGCPVHLVNRAEDLVDLCLELAKREYVPDA